MYIERNYGFWMTFNWSKKPFILGFIYATAISAASYFTDFYIALPWQPMSVIGIAVAFYLGFKNNSSYDRTWEARKIWGSIVNNSRSLGAAACSLLQGEKQDAYRRELVYRHIAWLTALRHQLRTPRTWEHNGLIYNSLFGPESTLDLKGELAVELKPYLSTEELDEVLTYSNCATQLLRHQSQRLQAIKDDDHMDDFRHMEFHQLIVSFYADQGKSERIKNFPFPRQYASTALWLSIVFCVFVPFGLVDVFRNQQGMLFWVSPFISALIIWIFMLMEKIGDYSENPFEGTYNDVPISSISRGIEIDMREMIHDTDIPSPVEAVNGFLM